MTADTLTADKLAEHRRAVEDAERELGAAALDGRSTTQAEKRLAQALANLRRAEAALAEQERRNADAANRSQEAADLKARAGTYRWLADYLTAVEEAIRAHEAAEAATAKLATFNPHRQRTTFGDLELDADVAIALRPRHNIPRPPYRTHYAVVHSWFTADRCAELRERALELAAQDEQHLDTLTGPAAADRASRREES